MKNKKILSLILSSLMIGATMVAPISSVYAEESGGTSVTQETTSTTTTTNGVATLGSGTASITLNGNANQTLIGKKFGVYTLFFAENSVGGESINYTFNPQYEQAVKQVVGKKLGIKPSEVTEYKAIDYIQTLNNNKSDGATAPQENEGRYSDFRYFIEELKDKMVALNMQPQVVNVANTRADNSIQIKGLQYGYYIIDEISNVAGTHSAGSLCIVNTANPTANVNVKSDYPSITKKIQEDDNIASIGNQGWNDIADYEIGQTVPYKFESNIPNMNGYHTYKYVWHDKMDKALTFNPASVGIKITNTNGKTYTLKANEFKVITSNIGNETFNVVIDDLKAIVDREFNQMNSNKENVYGQTVTLTYNATLNDNASVDTGRPGFENDVRLEFSNNPDSNGNGDTGFTPWDTVVCFTYKLDLTKTNDDNKVLANAKFRLYSDEKCQNEVYVKQNADGDYIVINRNSTNGNTKPAEAVEMVTKENGKLNIIGLDGQTYWLKETQAPAGYRPLLDPIKLTINPTFTTERNSYIKGDGATDKTLISLSSTATLKPFFDGQYHPQTLNLKTDVNEGNANLTVINKKGVQMPSSGSKETALIIKIGLCFVSAGLALFGYKKYRKYRTNEAK